MPMSQWSRSPGWMTLESLKGLVFGRWMETDGWNQVVSQPGDLLPHPPVDILGRRRRRG